MTLRDVPAADSSPGDAPIHTSIVDTTLTSSLESLDDAVNYRDWIVALAEPHLGERILEVGAGHGTFTEVLVDHGAVHAVEPGSHADSLLAGRFAVDDRVDVVSGVVADVDAFDFDTAVMINVLEHVDDEADVLAQIADRLKPGGRLVLWVPAFMLLYSRFDRKLGHHRRYRRVSLETLLAANGYDVLEIHHANLPGWFSWLLLVRILRFEPTNAFMVRFFDRFTVPLVRRLEGIVRPPFGQSLFVVAVPRPRARPTR